MEGHRLIWTPDGPRFLSAPEFLCQSFTCDADPPDGPVRDALERAIEANLEDPIVDRFIAFLDGLDGDVELEPSMGNLPPRVGDETEDCGDDEYALGSLDALADQSEWATDRGGHLRIDIDRELDAAE
ncbi:hypothetical protein LJR220_001654 [Bradyrhizobium sp. LjRoot220]|uniref:hypothetical protein n=1 Tax=Bradyrhizobium sp. LjRoot220 TaxID=3342284 RepID=UPI003ECC3584